MPWKESRFATLLILIQLVLAVLNAFFVKYDEDADASVQKHSLQHIFGGADPGENPVERLYPMFQDVNVMIFVGFGFLMTFLRVHGFSATGYTLLSTAIAVQTAILIRGSLNKVDNTGYIPLGIEGILEGLFSSAVVLISFGAVLGTISPIQLVVMTVIEVIVSACNEHLGTEIMNARDVGGSMFLHAFGAYFGLAVSFVLYRKDTLMSTKEESSRTSDLFAMIGTLFLWMYWPSFNSIPVMGDARHRAVLNTYMALCGSCVATFAISSLTDTHNKFSMVHVQNATLAGGVAMGATADMMVHPFGALIIGMAAGTVSTLGYRYLQPVLLRLRIHDTCGVHNLHGMPAIIGGIVAIIVAAAADEAQYNATLYERYPARAPVANSSDLKEAQEFKTDLKAGLGWTADQQALRQLYALGITLAVAILSGLLTGLFLMSPLFDKPKGEQLFDDDLHWEVPEVTEDEAASRPSNPQEKPPVQVIKRLTKTSSQDASGSRVAPEDAKPADAQAKF